MNELGLTRRDHQTGDHAVVSYWVRRGPRPFAFVHGLGYDAGMWRDVIARLPGDVGVVAMDVRGHGRSTLGTAYPSVELWAQDLLEVVAEEGLAAPAVCGLSMGGYAALAVAAAARERCRGFAFVSTAAHGDPPAKRTERAAALELLRERGAEAFCEALLPRLLRLDHPGAAARQSQARESFARAGAVGLSHTLLALVNRPDRRPLLGAIAQPSVVVVGDQDQLTPLADAQEIHDGLPAGRLVVVEGAAHMSAVERPDAVAEAIAPL